MFVDVHCHLDLININIIKEIITRAEAVNVKKMISNSTSIDSFQKNLDLSKEYDCVLSALGLHPSDFMTTSEEDVDRSFEIILDNLDEIVAIGEIGLDYKYAKNKAEKQKQQDFFVKCLQFAKENKKPVIIHTRYAEKRMLEILQEQEAANVLLHWFTNDKEAVKQAIDLEYFISVGPSIFHNQNALEIANNIPLDNLMLETDTPVPFMGENAEPSWIPRIAEKLSQTNGISIKEIEENTTKNAKTLFDFS